MFLIVCDAFAIALRMASSLLLCDVPTSSINLYVCADMAVSEHLPRGTLLHAVRARQKKFVHGAHILARNVARVEHCVASRVPSDVVVNPWRRQQPSFKVAHTCTS